MALPHGSEVFVPDLVRSILQITLSFVVTKKLHREAIRSGVWLKTAVQVPGKSKVKLTSPRVAVRGIFVLEVTSLSVDSFSEG